jgi:hypothetical protein
MAKFSGPQAITANRVLTGEVVYLSRSYVWVTELTKAARFCCAGWASDGLAIARLGMAEDPVQDPMLFDLCTNECASAKSPSIITRLMSGIV